MDRSISTRNECTWFRAHSGNAPLISNVITSFNYGRFLSQAIDSALEQTYPRIETIVVDDRSTDESRDIIRRYGNALTPLLQTVNRGQGACINIGFAASRGDIVIFLDSDDYLYPHAASRVASSWKEGIAKVQYRLDLVDAAGRFIDTYPAPEVAFDSGDVVPLLLAKGRYEATVTSGNAFTRSTLASILPMPEEDFRLCPDGYLVTVAPFVGRVLSLEEPLGAYRQHGGNNWGGGNSSLGARLRWALKHDSDKYRALSRKADGLGLEVPPEPGLRDHYHLGNRLASLRVEPEHHPMPSDSRVGLALRGVWAARTARLPWRRRFILGAWFLFVGLLPKGLARLAVNWRLDPTSRPARVGRVLKVIRSATRGALPPSRQTTIRPPTDRLGKGPGTGGGISIRLQGSGPPRGSSPASPE